VESTRRPENAQAPSGSADTAQAPSLARYDAACRAVAEAHSVDEVKDIRNQAVAMAAYARQAKNRDLEADAVEIRLRATRRLDQLRQAQKETVGLNQGAVPGKTGLRGNPVLDPRPTLASQGIDKGLAHQARVLGAMTDDAFERKVSEARDSAARVFRRAVREAEIAQEREERRARTALGGSIDDLHALIGSGFRAGVIAIDPPWPFATYSERARGAVTDHYETLAIDQIKALPIRKLAADNCAIFVWVIWPFMPIWAIVLEGWGVTYSGLAFDWMKLNPNGEGLHWGTNVDGRSSESRANAVNAVRKLRRPAMSSSERHRAGQPPHRLADVTRGTGGGLPLTHNFLDPARKPRAFLNSAVRNDKANSGIWAARVARLQTTRAAKEALIGIDLAAL
jgi:hypothetical protein